MSFNCKKLFVYAVSLYTWGSKVSPAQKLGVVSPVPPRVAPLTTTRNYWRGVRLAVVL